MRRTTRWAIPLTLAMITALLLWLHLDALGQEEKAPAEILTKENPVRFSGEVHGKAWKTYEQHCQRCHGPDGKGAGVWSSFLNTKARDLTNAKMMGARTDGELFWAITKGIKGIMPPFGDRLTESDHWGLVHLIRRMSNTKAKQIPGNVPKQAP